MHSAGAVHRFDKNGSRDAKALCAITQATSVRESEEVIDAAAGRPPDRAKMAEIMGRHGLTPTRLRLGRRAWGTSEHNQHIRFGITDG